MENKELTVKQITSKINQTEKKIDEYTRYIENYKEWITKEPNHPCISSYKSSLRDCEKKLNKYTAQLAEYKGMLEGRVKEYPIVRQFVKTWKEICIKHITDPKTIEDAVTAYDNMKAEIKALEEEYKAKGLPSWESYSERKSIEKSYNREWGYIWNYLTFSTKEIDMVTLEKDYEYEATRKYNKFIEDCEYYVGEILDTSMLSVGYKGDLNGFVVGTKGKAEVDTISACGEVQRFHYRTLFKMVK